LGLPPHPRRTRRTRLPDRRLHGVEDPQHGGDQPLTAASRAVLGAVSSGTGPRDPRLRPVPPRHHHPASALRLLRPSSTPPAGYTSWASPPIRRDRGPSKPTTCSWTSTTPATLPVPDPRPRRQIHRRLRRRLRRDRRRNHQRHRSEHRGSTHLPNASSAQSAANSSTTS
jgi:hypothetical protein